MIWIIISIVASLIALFLIADNKIKSDRIKVLEYALFYMTLEKIGQDDYEEKLNKLQNIIPYQRPKDK
ncbi:hypothetical protein [Staphylococcus auricularis]|uniref:hypothetical protein n=1 Tax=Staphylococcus auricularis TaxID=29379 RepID=UPI001F37EDAC|nr:hypothetical protein [Staphylococcus auricularis]MCE5038409.1 hypothetical protein [Staphylococcus auricularis]MEB6569069.1 hypothetical protein [Staphylococcus auricularis]